MGQYREKNQKTSQSARNIMLIKNIFDEDLQNRQSYQEKSDDIKQDFLQACEKFKSGPLLIEELQRKNIWLALETTEKNQRSQIVKLFPLNKEELTLASESDCKNWKLPQLILSRFYTKGEMAKMQETAYENSFDQKLDPSKYILSKNEKDIQRVNVYISPDFLPLFLHPNEFLNDLKKLIEIEKEKTNKNDMFPIILPVLNRILQQNEQEKQNEQQRISSGVEAAFKEKWTKQMQIFGITERGNALLLTPPLTKELLDTYKSVFVSTTTNLDNQQGNAPFPQAGTSIQSLRHLFRPSEEQTSNIFTLSSPMDIQNNMEQYIQERQRILYEQQFQFEKQKKEELENIQEKKQTHSRPKPFLG